MKLSRIPALMTILVLSLHDSPHIASTSPNLLGPSSTAPIAVL
jgi:hypothetical protein